jgi:2-methylcitrate dehydratase PrpD
MSDIQSIEATRLLATWATTVSNQWNPKVRAIAEQELEDTVAAAIAGSGDVGCAKVRSLCESGDIPVVGQRAGSSALWATLHNGTAAHAMELDDMFFVAGGHFGCAVIPAIWATAWQRDASLDDMLDAIIVGMEVMARVGMGIGRPHILRGWHGTQTLGAIAAAAACARLMKFDVDGMTHAISAAVSQAAGLKVQFGTDIKPVHAGFAAQSGWLAAQLAAAGLQGSAMALEGKAGFGDLYAGNLPADWSNMMQTHDVPLVVETHGIAFKLYPNCASAHRCIDAVRAIQNEVGFSAEDVAQVVGFVGPVNYENLKYANPTTPRQAMFSLPYAVASALRYGTVELADFTPQAVNDPETRKYLPLVDMQVTPLAETEKETATNLFAHKAIVKLNNGQIHEKEIKYARGMAQNPLSTSERLAKFKQCTEGIVPAKQLKELQALLKSPWGQRSRSLLSLLQFEAKVDDGSRFCRVAKRQ